MTRSVFKQLVAEAIDGIPARFARAVQNVAIVVEDWPDDDTVRELELSEDDYLLGLYQGVPLPERTWGHGNTLPDRVVLYQAAIEEECEGDEEEMVAAIGETLIHELGHYFGLSEREIMDIEERYWRGESA